MSADANIQDWLAHLRVALMQLRVLELKNLSGALGLTKGGNKGDLVTRIANWVQKVVEIHSPLRDGVLQSIRSTLASCKGLALRDPPGVVAGSSGRCVLMVTRCRFV
jgi:hypothetical protein